MGRFTKIAVAGLSAALLLAGSAFGQVKSLLDDFQENTNQNKFGDYWYFFDDNLEKSSVADVMASGKGTANSKVNSAGERGEGTTRELLFEPEKSIDQTLKAAKLDFVLGRTYEMGYNNTSVEASRNPVYPTCPAKVEADKPWWNPTGGKTVGWAKGCFDFQQFVGIGTNLVADGKTTAPKGFENATHVTFKAWGSREMAVRFFIEQSHVKGNAHFGRVFQVTTSPATFTIDLKKETNVIMGRPDGVDEPSMHDAEALTSTTRGGLVQPTYAAAQDYYAAFTLGNTVKMAWQVQADNSGGEFEPIDLIRSPNPLETEAEGWGGIFYLTDIEIHGFRFVAEDMCESCIVSAKPEDATVAVNDFATEDQPLNWLGYYWYAYDDTKTKVDNGTPSGSSEVGGDGVQENADSPTGWGLVTLGEDPNKYVEIEYFMGVPMKIGGDDVQPFVGIGTNLYEETAATPTYFNATEAGAHGLYFEYRTSSNKITFEVHDVADAKGDRIESAVWYLDLPGNTQGNWNKAVVPFSKLVQHTEWKSVADNPGPPHDKTKLAKFQFKYQGGANGDMAIRNVYLVGPSASVKQVSARANAAGIRATYNRGVVGVNWSAASQIAEGKISLVNIKGRTVATAPISKAGNKITANLGAGKVPAGRYFVRVNAKDVNGKRIVQQTPITVTK